VPAEIDAESALMEALAEVQEDLRPDDGEVEIPSDEEYNGWFICAEYFILSPQSWATKKSNIILFNPLKIALKTLKP
jgi:hypothetical protein